MHISRIHSHAQLSPAPRPSPVKGEGAIRRKPGRILSATTRPELYRRERSCGFTLIEIMVVLLILGIASALVVANLQTDDRQATQQEARKLMLNLQALQDRAVLGGRALGFSLTSQGPTVWERNERGDWQESRRQDLGARGALLTVEALKLGATPADPDARIVFLPEGIGMPFELTVSLRGHAALISGDALGNMTLKQDTK